MNNNIQEDYCSFEVSKLLKEKGFAQITDSGWVECPTHSLAIKWIRENFQWNIEVGYKQVIKSFISMVYPIQPNTRICPCGQYSKYEEATEAALKYTLENLIK